jgi:hypothetical protein
MNIYVYTISGLFGPFGEKGGPVGGTTVGDVSVGTTVHTADKSVTSDVIRITDEQYYTSFRLLDLIGAGAEGVCLPGVFDMVYPGLVDLLARTHRTPLLSGVLNIQMARLAVASVSDRAKIDGGEGEIRYIEMVAETLCSSYASIVSRMKSMPEAPVEGKKIISSSSSASKIGRSIVSGMSPMSGRKRTPSSAGSRWIYLCVYLCVYVKM